ncbi:MAG: transglutaminase domain-containing protein [Deltaproteobacteria bacterium]|nr:transglutaminase domain-containing protein [Deltaproteobacteria bacterium]
MKRFAGLFFIIAVIITAIHPAAAASFKKLDKPPLSERWFGIYVDKELVGFNRQIISETADGYRMEGDGSVRMKVMGFSKEASMRETYLVGKNLALRSFEVEQTLNGNLSRISGKVVDMSLRIRSEGNGRTTEKQLKFRGEIYPGPALNLYPLMREIVPGRSHRVLTFDPEEIKLKELTITVLGEEKAPDGRPALKLRNTLYPFVNNDILVDEQGNTLLETVRDGLVTTKAEDPKALGAFVGGVALAKKDLIFDFSLVRAEPPIKVQQKLKGLAVEISGWNDALPLLQEGGQLVEKSGEGRITVRTGSAVVSSPVVTSAVPPEAYLKPAEKIESDAPEILAKAKELAKGKGGPDEVVRAVASWTADWLKDTVDDGGGAVASFKSRSGNCQTHARLYTALARAAGIPTRFVSGLVHMEGKGFLYHSWAESLLEGRWVAVDPTYNQVPADPTHIKFFEGHLPEDMTPIIAIIGRIRIAVLETKY